MITVENLSKSYGDQEVLKGISRCFDTGKVYGIIGENGAGKTSLFRCIAGLETYTGHIYSSHTPLKNHLGLLLTDPFFFTKITGQEYLKLVCQARGKEIKNLEEKNIFALPLNRYASTYSTGMKKKLALLGILLQNNDYFILDEPYNGVDIQSNIIISEIILKLKQSGKTVLISSHIFSTLSDTCDEILLLKEGRFTRTVTKNEFSLLEQEMKNTLVDKRIDNLWEF
ncbi:MAG TPA: ATP-binding cassette domain-containing protein [Flavipsychrobacter sp.]|nr:ATP-binding cassette domain-containing protein [Flavipsychrobacter sp.]